MVQFGQYLLHHVIPEWRDKVWMAVTCNAVYRLWGIEKNHWLIEGDWFV